MSVTALSVLHKYIRREMFDISQRLFRAGPDCLEGIRAALDDAASLLRDHAMQEEQRLGPLLRQLDPSSAERLNREHVQLEKTLDEVLQSAAAIDPSREDSEAALQQLQLDWNRLLGRYLLHLDEEERTWFTQISAHVPPVGYVAQIAAALGPKREEEFLLKLWSVVTPAEMRAVECARELRSVA